MSITKREVPEFGVLRGVCTGVCALGVVPSSEGYKGGVFAVVRVTVRCRVSTLVVARQVASVIARMARARSSCPALMDLKIEIRISI